MVDETDNHGLNKYTQGEDNWEHSSDMDTIEERLTIKDTDANKSNYTPHDGALYIATDTGVVYDGDGSSWVKAGRGFKSVNTDRTRSNSVAGVIGGPHQKTLQTQYSRFSWANLSWEDKGEAIIDGSSLDGSAGYPCFTHGPSLVDNPIDEWYCYWSGHNDNGIVLSTAPELWGPWTSQGSVLSDGAGTQTASPWVIPEISNTNLRLYYHSDEVPLPGSQQTKYATASATGDGTSWTIQGPTLEPNSRSSEWDRTERTYTKVYREGNEWLAVYQGRDDGSNAAGIGVAWSDDGLNWTTETTPAYLNNQFDGADHSTFLGGSPALSTFGGRRDILYSDTTAEEIRVAPFDARDRPLNTAETVFGVPSWASGPSVHPAAPIIDGQYLYLGYGVGDGSSDNLNIGMARTELKDVGAGA